jgi:biotin operon repressor
MRDELSTGLSGFLSGLSANDRDRSSSILRSCASMESDAATPRFGNEFPAEALLLVEDGFVVLRATASHKRRSVVTCEAGAGRVLLAPAPEEVLVGLGRSHVTVIDPSARAELLRIPTLAERIVEQLTIALAEKQGATANFAPTRHVDRVRRKLLQLARSYGHVVRDGIRIDFPISHALLAEMIGSSRETVTRAVDQLQRAGFVERSGSTYRLVVLPESVFEQPQPEPRKAIARA